MNLKREEVIFMTKKGIENHFMVVTNKFIPKIEEKFALIGI